MQETPTTSRFQRLHVWSLTASFAVAALIIGVLSLPVHLLKRHREFGGMPGGPGGPGGPMMPYPMQSGVPHPWMSPHPWGPPGAMMQYHYFGAAHQGSIGIALLGIVIFAIVAGIAGAIIAAVYNQLLPKN